MARLERGKGKRKQIIEIVRLGDVLRMQETEAGDARLPGYRRFADDAAAAANLAVEVRSLLDDGMQPADDEARGIADAQPKKASGPPVLPIRQDLAIYNEANGFVVTSRRMAGKTLEEGSPEWNKAVVRGDMLPLTLVQDDPFIVRVVAGGALTAQEDEEWLARVDWHVNVPDGRLCVTGGSVFANGDYDSGDPYYEQHVGEVLIPKGRYRATVYTQAHGVNGGAVLDHLAGGFDKGEPLDEWFARTRPGASPVDSETELVDFLLHLEPIDAAPKSGLSALPDEGWFGGAENARKPERCPAGLAARDVIRTSRGETPGKWTFVRHVAEMMPASADPQPVQGDPVTLALDAIGRAVRIAWFGSRLMLAELRLTPPPSSSIDLRGEWPEGIVGVADGDLVRIVFDADLDGREIANRLPQIGPRLAAVPDGTVLEVCCAPVEAFPGTPAEAGLVMFRGPIHGSSWTLAHAYPSVNGTTLRAALSLAAEVEGTAIAVADDAEGREILSAAKRFFGHHVESNPPRLAGGAIRFEKSGPEPGLIGISIFAMRFGGTWPTAKLAALDDDGDEDEDDEDDIDEGGDGLFPTTPIKGAEVLTAASGRTYNATMSMLVSEKIGADVPKRERPLFSAGFKHVGDVVCSADVRVAFRGYVKPEGGTWAYFRIAAPDRIELELASVFAEKDAVLVTTGNDGERDDEPAATYRQGFAGATVPELVAHHERRLAELTPFLGAARPAERTLRSLAETLEAVWRRSGRS